MTSALSARELALQVLRRIEEEGAYANLALPAELHRSRLSDRDRAFVTDLVMGSTRMRRGCDALVDRFITREPSSDVRRVLRLGAYQLSYAGVPAHAAVGETVQVAPKAARGFVNAVLRRVASTPMIWPSPAVEHSYPDWIAARLEAELGDEAWPAMRAMNEGQGAPMRDDGYRQDVASQWVAEAVEAEPGELVLDVCSAPGGKATAIAATGAFVCAADVQLSRARQVVASAASTRRPCHVVVADGRRPSWAQGAFDRVLLDAPCSGLGALRRRADARWRITNDDIDALVRVQGALLAASAPLVKPGGRLVYSVCTLTAAESIAHRVPDGFDVDPTPPGVQWEPYGHGFRVLPHHHDTDGMVMVRYRRRQ
jgi:16S rRNA (cytosine967-C5)-methyltransferase